MAQQESDLIRKYLSYENGVFYRKDGYNKGQSIKSTDKQISVKGINFSRTRLVTFFETGVLPPKDLVASRNGSEKTQCLLCNAVTHSASEICTKCEKTPEAQKIPEYIKSDPIFTLGTHKINCRKCKKTKEAPVGNRMFCMECRPVISRNWSSWGG